MAVLILGVSREIVREHTQEAFSIKPIGLRLLRPTTYEDAWEHPQVLLHGQR